MRFLILFLLLLTSVHAALNVAVVNHETDVQSTYEHLKVCSCGATNDVIRIKNIGALEAAYTLTLQSTQDWFTLEKTTVTLAANESTDIHIYIHAPCTTIASAQYTVYVASEYGRYRAITKDVQTGVCENVGVTVAPLEFTVEPCASQNVTMNVVNTGTFTDTYTVASDLPFNETSFDIEPGKTKSITAPYTASCSEYGTKSFPVQVHSETNNQAIDNTISITTPRSYDYSVQAHAGALVCAQAPATVNVTVQNLEPRGNTFTLTSSPTTNTTTVYIGANSTKSVPLTFTPTSAGTTDFTVNARSANGSLEKSARISIPVQACYGFTLQAAPSVQSCPSTVHIPFTVTSTGSQSQSVTFDVRSNATTQVQGMQAMLNPGQSLERTVQVNIPDIDGTYYVTFSASTPYTTQESTTQVRGFSTETCYRVAPTSHMLRLWTDQTVQPLVITHTGVEPATYTIRYNGSVLTPQEDTITLAPGKQGVLHFSVNATTPGSSIERLTLESHGVQYTTDLGITVREKGLWEQFLDAIRYNGEFGLCSIISLIAFIIFLVTLGVVLGIAFGAIYYENPQGLHKNTAGIVGGIILIILLLLMLMTSPHINRAYERPVGPSNESALRYEMGQDDELHINLTQFFTDPDSDNLTFTANQPAHLKVRIADGVANVKSDGTPGEDTLVFTASDRKGGSTDSDLIHVDVVAFKPVGFLGYWMASCWFATLVLLFLTTLLIMSTLLFTKDKPQRLKHATKLTLYRRPRTDIVAHAPSTTIGTQVNAEHITINQGNTEQLWVASEDGTKFHRITCPIIKNMPKDKRITFTAREDAIKAGYTPCKTCSSHE